MADAREKHLISENLRKARRGSGKPFLNRLNANANPERCWREISDVMETSPVQHVADFMRCFYTSADPKISGLKAISCPVLLLLGEHDELFLKPNELMARTIPNSKHVVLNGLGHMTAIEDPQRTVQTITEFLREHDFAPT
jgi:pimeloyl-ACP methyl ester carboxylesterase